MKPWGKKFSDLLHLAFFGKPRVMNYVYITLEDRILWIESQQVTVWSPDHITPVFQLAGKMIGLSKDEQWMLLERGRFEVVLCSLLDGNVKQLNAPDRERFEPHQQVRAAAFIPDAEVLFSNAFDHQSQLFHYPDPLRVNTQATMVCPPFPFCFVNANLLLENKQKGVTGIIDMRTYQYVTYIDSHHQLHVASDEEKRSYYLAVYSRDLEVIDLQSGSVLYRWRLSKQRGQREIVIKDATKNDKTPDTRSGRIENMCIDQRSPFHIAVYQGGAIWEKQFDGVEGDATGKLDIPRGLKMQAMSFGRGDFKLYGIVTNTSGAPRLMTWDTLLM